ncbi:hypothetical protein GCM10029963_47320 [Micromonospora andamanensis]
MGGGAQSFGDGREHLVTCGVAEGVVYLLEMVQVDQDEGAHPVGMPLLQVVVARFEQVAPVRQAGEGVVRRVVRVGPGHPGEFGVRLGVADGGTQCRGEGVQRVVLPLGELHRSPEAQPQHAHVDGLVVPFQPGGHHRALDGGGLVGRPVVRDSFGAAAYHPVVVAQLDLHLVGGEEFGGPCDSGGQDLVQLDHVERVGGLGEPLPHLLLGTAADPCRVEQMQAEHQRRHREEQPDVDVDEQHRADDDDEAGHGRTDAETPVLAEQGAQRGAGRHRDDGQGDEFVEQHRSEIGDSQGQRRVSET